MLFATTGTDDRRPQRRAHRHRADEHPAPRAPDPRPRQSRRRDPQAESFGTVQARAWAGEETDRYGCLGTRTARQPSVDARRARQAVINAASHRRSTMYFRSGRPDLEAPHGADVRRPRRRPGPRRHYLAARGRSGGVNKWRTPAHSRRGSGPRVPGGSWALERERRQALTNRLPEILIDAQRIAQTIAHGLHSSRRAGPGETFWQFRQFQAATRCAGDRLAALGEFPIIFTCANVSGKRRIPVAVAGYERKSMNFRSHLASTTKHDRAVLLMLAAAELLVRGGERIAMLGLTQPTGQPQGDNAHGRSDPRPRRLGDDQRHAAAEGATRSLLGRHPVQRLPRPHRQDARARRSSHRPDRRDRPSHRDRRSGRRDASLRGTAPNSSPPTAANAGSPTACKVCARNTRRNSKRTAPSRSS